MKQAPKRTSSGHAVGYARVSSEEQAKSGLGLESQDLAVTAYCAQHAITLRRTYRDEGRSGALPVAKRPGLRAALAALEPGDQLVVPKRDRLGRDPILVALVELEIERKGCRLASAAGEGTDADDPGSILIRRVVDAIAENFRLVTGVRTAEAHARKRSRGEWLGSLPFGSRVATWSEEGRPDTIEPCPVELAQLAEMRRMHRAGMGPRAIARDFTARGVRRMRPGKWDPGSISRLLRRDTDAQT